MKQQLQQLQDLVNEYIDDFSLPQSEAELLVSCAEHIATLKGNEQKQYAQQCAAYYRQERPDDFFISPEGRHIFDTIADAYTRIASNQETQ